MDIAGLTAFMTDMNNEGQDNAAQILPVPFEQSRPKSKPTGLLVAYVKGVRIF